MRGCGSGRPTSRTLGVRPRSGLRRDAIPAAPCRAHSRRTSSASHLYFCQTGDVGPNGKWMKWRVPGDESLKTASTAASMIHPSTRHRRDQCGSRFSAPASALRPLPSQRHSRWSRRAMSISSSAACTSRPRATRWHSVASIGGCAISTPIGTSTPRRSLRKPSRPIRPAPWLIGALRSR